MEAIPGIWNCKLCDYIVENKLPSGLTSHLFNAHNIKRVDGGLEKYVISNFGTLLCCCGCGESVKLAKRESSFALFAPGCKGLNRSRTPGCVDFYLYQGMEIDEAIEAFRLRQKLIATTHSTEELRNKISECNTGDKNPASISSIMKRTGKPRREVRFNLSARSSGSNNGFFGKTHDCTTINDSAIRITRTRSNQAKFVSKPELAIWGMLQALNVEFSTQIAIERYVVDFLSDNVVIEVFGDYWHSDAVKMRHISKPEKDQIKIARLKELGYQVEIVWESEIFKQPQLVVERLRNLLRANKID